MKKLLFLTSFFPTLLYAKKQAIPNACDSMKAVVIVDEKLSAQKICSNLYAALKAYPLHQYENIEVQKIDDSTIVGSGKFVMKRTKNIYYSKTYGSYRVRYNGDGHITFKIYINCKAGKFRYEFTDLNHIHAQTIFGDLCTYEEKDRLFTEINGLRVTFLYRIDDIVATLKKVNEHTDW